MEQIKKIVISEITGMKNKYLILENGDIMVVVSEKSMAKVEEIKNANGEDCVKLLVDVGKYEYFKKSDLRNGLISPLDRHEIKQRKNEKPVGMYKDGLLIATFYNINVASKETGISQSGIYNCCNKVGYCKTAGGYEWRYE